MAYAVFYDVKFDNKDDSILQYSSQEPSMSSKYDSVLSTLIFMLESPQQEQEKGPRKGLDLLVINIPYPIFLISLNDEP